MIYRSSLKTYIANFKSIPQSITRKGEAEIKWNGQKVSPAGDQWNYRIHYQDNTGYGYIYNKGPENQHILKNSFHNIRISLFLSLFLFWTDSCFRYYQSLLSLPTQLLNNRRDVLYLVFATSLNDIIKIKKDQ